MPISAEQWRVATGLVNARYAPCPIRSAASPHKYLSRGTLFLRACVAVLQAFLFLALDTDWWGPWVGSVRGHNVREPVVIVVVHLHVSGSEGQSSVRFYVPALRILLIIAGDVEENPGPPKVEGGLRPTLPQLVEEFGSYPDWDFLGLFLGIDENTITSIKSTEREVKRQCWKLFSLWLRKTPTASWEEVCTALEKAGDETQAHSLREKYCHPAHQQTREEGTRQGEGQTELHGAPVERKRKKESDGKVIEVKRRCPTSILDKAEDQPVAHSSTESLPEFTAQQQTSQREGQTELHGTGPVAASYTEGTSTAESVASAQAPHKTHPQSTPPPTEVAQRQQGKTHLQEEQSVSLKQQVETSGAHASPSVCPPRPTVPAPPLALPPMDQYASYLKSVYMSDLLPTYSKWPPTSSKRYIHLAVVKKEKVSKKEADKFTKATIHGNINDILQEKVPVDFSSVGKKEDGSAARFILVEGAPGIGKTTFAWQLCREWASRTILQEYKLVILLRLRDRRIREAKTVFDLFYHANHQLRHSLSQQVQHIEGRSTFLVFEGYDELPGKMQTVESIFLDILYKNVLPEATVLVTSRPSATEFLHWTFREQVSQHIEILGFTTDDIQSYIHSVMDDPQVRKKDPNVREDFAQYLKCYSYIQGMMYVPLNAVIVAEVYKTSRESPDKFIPTTMTELYTALTRGILLRYLLSHRKYGRSKWTLCKFSDLPKEIYKQFKKVCSIAFSGMIKDEFIFDNLPKDFDSLDLMQSSPELYVGQGALVSYNFFHLTLQEYLAAVHISHQRPEEQIEYFRGSFRNVLQPQTSAYRGRGRGRGRGRAVMSTPHKADYHVSPVRPGHQRTETGTEYSHHTPRYATRPPTPRGQQSDLTHEELSHSSPPRTSSQGPTIPPMQTHTSLHAPMLPFVPYVHHTPLHATVPYPQHTMALPQAPMLPASFQFDEDKTAQRLKTSLRFAAGVTKFENLPLDSLRSLLLKDGKISLDALHWLFEAQGIDTYSNAISGTTNLQYTHRGSMTPFDCFVLGHAVSHINCIWTVKLSSCYIGNEGLEMLVAGMHYNKDSSPHSHLPVSLVLFDCDITPEGLHYLTEMPEHVATSVTGLYLGSNPIGGGAAHFFSKFPGLRSMTTLSLWHTKMTSEDTKALGELLSQPDSQQLELLNLNDNSLTPEGTGWIVGALPHNTTLKELFLDGSHVTMENVSSLTRALSGHCGLKRLTLDNCKIDSDTACEIASALCENSTLERLHMEGNQIGPRGAAAFADMLRKNRTLLYLDLHHDSIGKEGTCKLAKSLQYNTTLNELGIPKQYKSSLPLELYSATKNRLRFL